MPQRNLRLALALAIIGVWFGFLGWMAATSSKPPTQRGSNPNVVVPDNPPSTKN